MVIRAIALVGVAAAGIGCRRAQAERESRASLVGRASFPDSAITQSQIGNVRLILRGVGDISDACPDAGAREFVAEYDGTLELSPDGSFAARLAPFDPPVATPSGCIVTRVVVEHLDEIVIEATVPALELEGDGWLDFQTLTTVDNDELQTGAFGDLHATLVLHRRSSDLACVRGDDVRWPTSE